MIEIPGRARIRIAIEIEEATVGSDTYSREKVASIASHKSEREVVLVGDGELDTNKRELRKLLATAGEQALEQAGETLEQAIRVAKTRRVEDEEEE